MPGRSRYERLRPCASSITSGPPNGVFDAWDVDRLIALSRHLPVEQVPLSSIHEVDTPYWFNGSPEVPTVREVVEHCRLIVEADPSYPVILGYDGRVMDGRPRYLQQN